MKRAETCLKGCEILLKGQEDFLQPVESIPDEAPGGAAVGQAAHDYLDVHRRTVRPVIKTLPFDSARLSDPERARKRANPQSRPLSTPAHAPVGAQANDEGNLSPPQMAEPLGTDKFTVGHILFNLQVVAKG